MIKQSFFLLLMISLAAMFGMQAMNEQSTLIKAVTTGDEPLIRALIASGVDVNERNDQGLTPLHFAIHSPNASIAKLLIDSGADANIRSNAGSLAFIQAIGNGLDEHVKAIIDGLAARVEHSEKKMALLTKSTGAGIYFNIIPQDIISVIMSYVVPNDLCTLLEAKDAEGLRTPLVTAKMSALSFMGYRSDHPRMKIIQMIKEAQERYCPPTINNFYSR